jgi:surface antigen
MRWVSTLAIGLACAACQPYPNEQQIATLPDQPQSSGQSQPGCRDFTAPVTAAGKPEQSSGQACQQPDGSWRVVQNTPGLPAQTYLAPPPGQPIAAAAGAATQPTPNQPAAAGAAAQPTPDQPPCSRYTAAVTVGGQPQQAVIEECPQPDGSWKITQNTPGLPQQVYEIPPPASSPYPYGYQYPADYLYPDFFPYWEGAPWFFGLAPSIVVVQRFHHFHRGFGHGFARGFGGGFWRGFRGGFGHGVGGGFGHGLGGGFGHGFAAARAGGGRR